MINTKNVRSPLTYDIDLGFYLFVFFNSELGWISSPFQSAPGSIFGSRYKVVRKNSGLPEPPIFEIFGSGSSSRQIPAPAPDQKTAPAPPKNSGSRRLRGNPDFSESFVLVFCIFLLVVFSFLKFSLFTL